MRFVFCFNSVKALRTNGNTAEDEVGFATAVVNKKLVEHQREYNEKKFRFEE